MAYFRTQNPNLGRFWKLLQLYNLRLFWSILQPFGIFSDHLVYFGAIWYILCFLVYFSPFWFVVPGKIWQPWTATENRSGKSEKGFNKSVLKVWDLGQD
jgi:hypothetical protein